MNSKNSSESRKISPGQAFFEKMCNPQILRENLKKAIEKKLGCRRTYHKTG